MHQPCFLEGRSGGLSVGCLLGYPILLCFCQKVYIYGRLVSIHIDPCDYSDGGPPFYAHFASFVDIQIEKARNEQQHESDLEICLKLCRDVNNILYTSVGCWAM